MQLLSSLGIVLPRLAQISFVVAVLVGLASLAERADSVRSALLRVGTFEHWIVATQRDRAQGPLRASLLLLGDSSCLMGIDAAQLSARLGRHVENLCSLGYLGPAGYAAMLDQLLSSNPRPDRLVLVFNPVQFDRRPEYEAWTQFASRDAPLPDPSSYRAVASLDYVRTVWLDRVLYDPLPYGYGVYYGGGWQLMAELRERQGSLVDPVTGLNSTDAGTIHPVDQRDIERRIRTTPYPAMTDEFKAALPALAAAIARYGRDDAWLFMTPMPQFPGAPAPQGDYATDLQFLARALNVDARNILAPVAPPPYGTFSNAAHPNRFGRIVVTDRLAERLLAARRQ